MQSDHHLARMDTRDTDYATDVRAEPPGARPESTVTERAEVAS